MYRIGIGGFSHETHTFCPSPTDIRDFEEQKGVQIGDEILNVYRNTESFIAGYLKVLEQHDVEIVPTLYAHAGVKNYVTKAAFDKYSNKIAEMLCDAGRLDAVLLALHGAMVSEQFPKAEAEIVRRVRDAVGDVPIFVTLDLHANEDHEITDVADACFVLKEYPHTDKVATGSKAAECLLKTLSGEFRPAMALAKPGILSPSVFQATADHPMKLFRAHADAWEAKEQDVYHVGIAAGFGYADVADAGASVIVVTNDDKALAEEVARNISALMWEFRDDLTSRPIMKPKEAVARAIQLVRKGIRPVLLGDGADRTGDNTLLLRELLAQAAKNFGHSVVCDPEAVRKCESAGLGNSISVTCGGWAPMSGEPIELTGKIVYLGSGDYVRTGPKDTGTTAVCGPTAVLDIRDGNYVILTTLNHQCQDEAGFVSYGIDFDKLDIIVVKSRVHFKAYYEKVAGEIIDVDAPGLGPADLRAFTYKHVPKDIYPVGANWLKVSK